MNLDSTGTDNNAAPTSCHQDKQFVPD